MQSQDNLRIALLSAYAIALHGFERLIPTPIPWMRFGLANIITLTTLIVYGFRPAMMITLIRVVVGSFFAGTFLGPAFILSLGAGIASTTAMGIIVKGIPGLFGPVGLSLIGALFHNITQLMLAYVIFIKRFEVVIILSPFIIIIGTITGTMNGIISGMLIRGLNKHPDKRHNRSP